MPKTKFDPKHHHRRSIRLPEYDYSHPGAYFVTMVAWRRECLFGKIIDGEVKLNQIGNIVAWQWNDLPKRLRYIELGASVVMPNHFHGILIFHEHVGATRQGSNNIPVRNVLSPKPKVTIDGKEGSPLRHGPRSASLGAILAQFKSRVTKRVWKIPSLKGTPIWQRNYYERIIGNDRDLQNTTDYINANPLLWEQDNENPLKIGHNNIPPV